MGEITPSSEKSVFVPILSLYCNLIHPIKWAKGCRLNVHDEMPFWKKILVNTFGPLRLETLKMYWGRFKGRRFPEHRTVFIIGQNKTGTTSVSMAFRQLGTNHLTINSACMELFYDGNL